MTADPDEALRLFISFWQARGVLAAVDMGLFDALDGAPAALPEAAARLGLRERPARALLDTCRAAGLLDRDEQERYRLTPLGSLFTAASPHSLRNYALDERWCWGNGWERLETLLREDRPALPPDGSGYHEFPADFFLDFLHGHTLAMAERLAAGVDLTGATRLLDVGAGSGATSMALCAANPGLTSVLVDRPEVLAKAAGHAAAAGLGERISGHPANIFSDPMPAGCDAGVIANVLHDFSEDKARTIIRRTAEALPSGAPLIVMEVAPDDDRSGPPLAVAFSLGMIVNTEGGEAWTVAELSAWLEDEGCSVERVVPIGRTMVTAGIVSRVR